jgi:lysophospholipase L1-like esterase
VGRRRAGTVVALTGAVLAAGAAVMGLQRDSATPAATSGVAWYLALGDSLAAGVQPSNAGDGTDRDGGYAGGVRDRLGERQSRKPELTNLGCPGETTATLADGGLCGYPEGSQLAEARAFLARQPDGGAAGLVTVQVGANDVLGCLTSVTGAAIDEPCVATGLSTVHDRLPQILAAVRSAAPKARLVVLDYYNPFLAAELLGPRTEPLASRSQEVLADLNTAIGQAATADGASVADVPNAFAAGSQGVCDLTWMCASVPDIHATNAGYARMADAVLETLGETG